MVRATTERVDTIAQDIGKYIIPITKDNTKIGEITEPIKIPVAFIILNVKDKRETLVKLDINSEVERLIKRKTNEQLNQFSNIYFNKIKKDVKINEL